MEVRRRLYNSTFFIRYVPQYLKSSPEFSYVANGYCATSVNTSIFRKSAVISGGGFQYVGFYDHRGNVVIGKRKLKGKRWKLRVTRFTANIRDAHNGISLGIDGDGSLHLAFGMHGAKLKYTRSVKPHSLKFSPLIPMNGEEEERATYPEFHTLINGELLFFYRNGVSGNGNMVIKRYSPKEKSWITVQRNLIDGEGERNAYWQAWVDNVGKIYLSWVWRERPDVSSNHDICFAYSNDGGATWRKSTGEVYDLPVTIKNAEMAWRVPQGSDLINQTSMTVDDAGKPYIATYWRDMNSSVPQYRMVWHDGEKWNMQVIGNRIMPFSLSGKGTKMVPISRPLILCDSDQVNVVFRDREYGGGPMMASTEKITGSNWKLTKLADFDADAWEPTFDENLWKKEGRLHLFLQTTHQGDGEKVAKTACHVSPVYILQYFSRIKKR